MSTKLEPCPFCGKVPKSLERDNDTECKWYTYRIRCKKCRIPSVARRTAGGAMRAWNKRKLLVAAVMLLLCVRVASAETVKVRVLFAAHSEAVPTWYLDAVQEKVRKVYKDELGINLRFSRRVDFRVNHAEYRDLARVDDEFDAYRRILKQNPRYTRLVVLPPYFTDNGASWGTGLSLWFSTTVVRQTERKTGLDRFNSDWVSMAHELCHSIAYNTGRFCAHQDGYPNIMHSNALAYADLGLGFAQKTVNTFKKVVVFKH